MDFNEFLLQFANSKGMTLTEVRNTLDLVEDMLIAQGEYLTEAEPYATHTINEIIVATGRVNSLLNSVDELADSVHDSLRRGIFTTK